MAESRQALISWINELLQLNLSKVDQLGTGAAYCQIMDSIYHDVPLSRVNFDAKNEYDYQHNFKILQSVFTRHGIERTFDTQRLMRCRLQDNLEFAQWLRRFWLENAPQQEYDAVARRSSRSASAAGFTNGKSRQSVAPGRATPSGRVSRSSSTSSSRAAVRGAFHPSNRTPSGTSVTGLGPSKDQGVRMPAAHKISDLEGQVDELEESLAIVTTERTLYYGKLLEIEELVQKKLDLLYSEHTEGTEIDQADPQVALIRNIQTILYATAEGFETPYRPEDEPF